MKPEVTLKYLTYLRNKKNNGQEGFTLIELLVVVIIIGVLAAVALPNLLGQVGKARIAEAKNNAGAVNRGQQAYFLEKSTFGTMGDLDVQIPTSKWYDVPTTTPASTTTTTVTFKPKNAGVDNTTTILGTVTYTASTGAFEATVSEGT